MRFESRLGSGEQPTTAQVRVPVRIARTSSTGGSSGDRGCAARPPALGEPVEHERGVGDRHAGEMLLPRPRSRRRSPARPPRTRRGPRPRARRSRRPRGRTRPSRRACPRRRGRRARRCRPRGTPSARAQHAGGESIVGPELLAHVRDRVLAGQDRRLGVADEPAVAAAAAPPPTRRGRRPPRAAAARSRRCRRAARAGRRRRRRSPPAWRPRGAPSRRRSYARDRALRRPEQPAQPLRVLHREALPVVVEVDVTLAAAASAATRGASSRSSVSL